MRPDQAMQLAEKSYSPIDPTDNTGARIERFKKSITFDVLKPEHDFMETHVASITFRSTINVQRRPDGKDGPFIREELVNHLLRAIYGDQRGELMEIIDELERNWTPVPRRDALGSAMSYPDNAFHPIAKLREMMKYTLPGPVDKRD